MSVKFALQTYNYATMGNSENMQLRSPESGNSLDILTRISGAFKELANDLSKTEREIDGINLSRYGVYRDVIYSADIISEYFGQLDKDKRRDIDFPFFRVEEIDSYLNELLSLPGKVKETISEKLKFGVEADLLDNAPIQHILNLSDKILTKRQVRLIDQAKREGELKEPETIEEYILHIRLLSLSCIIAISNKPELTYGMEDVKGLEDVFLNIQYDKDIDSLKFRYKCVKLLSDVILERMRGNEDEVRKLLFDFFRPGNTIVVSKKGDKFFMEVKSKEGQVRSTALEELKKIEKEPKLGQIRTSKDLIESKIHTAGDIAEIGNEKEKKVIQDLQKKGKLLFGTLEGLSGGTAYFKAFSIALAKILNEQVKYYKTEENWSGIPKKLLSDIMGESAKIERSEESLSKKSDHVTIGGESRPFPYILVSYARLAKEMSKDWKVAGGKDIEVIKRYINGGYTKFETDSKTGERKPVKSSYIQGLTSKKYPVSNGNGGYIFLPYIVNEAEIVDSTLKDPEVGCILRLTPQYSMGVRKYSNYRSDTIQLLGGGRQKDITMDLLETLVYSRGVSKEYKTTKSNLLSKYSNTPNYKGRPGKLAKDFIEAVHKVIDAKVLLPGESNGVLNGYREEKNSGGAVICIFTFNPDYLKGDEMSNVEEQYSD